MNSLIIVSEFLTADRCRTNFRPVKRLREGDWQTGKGRKLLGIIFGLTLVHIRQQYRTQGEPDCKNIRRFTLKLTVSMSRIGSFNRLDNPEGLVRHVYPVMTTRKRKAISVYSAVYCKCNLSDDDSAILMLNQTISRLTIGSISATYTAVHERAYRAV